MLLCDVGSVRGRARHLTGGPLFLDWRDRFVTVNTFNESALAAKCLSSLKRFILLGKLLFRILNPLVNEVQDATICTGFPECFECTVNL